MKFAITNTDNMDKEKREEYKEILQKYNLKANSNILFESWHIDINSLDDLIELKCKLNKEIIITDTNETINELMLEIYDGYR